MTDLEEWLDALGLGKYLADFEAAEIGSDVLADLSEDDLRELGIALGDRKRLLRAVRERAGLRSRAPANSSIDGPEPERRQLTILFSDIVGWTALSARIDPELLREVIRSYQAACHREISRFDGFIAHYKGDGIMAYFGHPTAHEDDPERAVHAGLHVAEAVARLGETLRDRIGADLAVRVGIATGPVIVGDVIGEGISEERAVVGETPNLASRLQSLAAPGEVVVSRRTYQLAGPGFECETLPPRLVKGFEEPIHAWRVLRLRPFETRFESRALYGLTPLIGREHELGLLMDRWEDSKSGDGQVVMLSGEPGIGKSRVARALTERMRADAHHRLRFQCSAYHTNSALYPFIDQLERSAKVTPADSPSLRREKLRAAILRTGDGAAARLPLIESMVALEGDAARANVSPERQKETALHAVTDHLRSLSAERPLVMIFEDVHWADPTSIELLGLLIEAIATMPALLLLTFRAEFEPQWGDHGHVTGLMLGRLGRKLAAAMVSEISTGEPLTETVLAQIVERTDGNPLFVEELTKTVLQSQQAREEKGHYAPGAISEIPATLKDSLMARLDRYPWVREVAQAASAIGRIFSFELLAAVSGENRSELEAALDQLVDAGLVHRRGGTDDVEFAFKHALVQDAAYESMLISRREVLHRKLGDVMETRFEKLAELHPEVLAHHFTEGRDTDRAIAYWHRAGLRAVQRSAMAESIAHLGKGLSLMERCALDEAQIRRQLDMQTALGAALTGAKGYTAPETVEAYEAAWRLCETIDESPLAVEILSGMWNSAQVGSDYDRALELSNECLRRAERLPDTASKLIAHNIRGVTAVLIGDFETGRTHLSEVTSLYNPGEHRSLVHRIGEDPGVGSLAFLSWAHWSLGYADQAVEFAEQAIAWARDLSYAPSLAYALAIAGRLYQLRREPAQLIARADEAVALCTDQNMPFHLEWVKNLKGWALVERDRAEEGMAMMSNRWQQGYSALLMAQAHLRLGHPDEGLTLLREVAGRQPYFESETLSTQGALWLALPEPQPARAERCFREAMTVAQRQKARSYELRAAAGLAGLWIRQGRGHEARELIAPLYEWFDEGLETADLTDAAALLDRAA